MKTLYFTLVTPEKIAYESEVESLTLMTTSGEITVLPDHTDLITVIQPGELHIVKSGITHTFVTGQGVLEIGNNRAQILVNTTESQEDIDVARAQQAVERARAVMSEQADVYDVDYARIEASIARHMARIRVANKNNRQ